MIAPLDPAIAQIIPLLPLRDPDTMTPQSARDALRALVAARADIPPPQVQTIDEMEVMGADVRLPARVYRVSREKSPTVVFFHGGSWVAGDLETHDRQALPQSTTAQGVGEGCAHWRLRWRSDRRNGRRYRRGSGRAGLEIPNGAAVFRISLGRSH